LNNQNLLDKILDISEKHCGSAFVARMLEIKKEREKYLNNIWKNKDYESLIPKGNVKNSTRKIDFDTAVYFAEKKLAPMKFKAFIQDVITVAFDNGEMEYARDQISYLLHSYFENLSKSERASIYQILGEIYVYQNDFERSNQYFDQSLDIYHSLMDYAGLAKIKNSLGILMIEKGLYKEGKSLFLEAREIALENNVKDIVIKCDINLGNYYYMVGDTIQALEKYFIVKEYAEENNNAVLLGKVLINIASTYKQKYNYQKALDFLAKAADITEKTDNKFLKALFYLVKGEILIYNGQLQSSMALLICAFTLFSEIGDKLSIADTYRAFGILFREKNNEKVALSYLENSIKINKVGNNYLNLGESYVAMAELFVKRGDNQKAKDNYEEAKKYFSLFSESAKIQELDKIINNL
jgi:tetratricopeptide (TPR) repeat protein